MIHNTISEPPPPPSLSSALRYITVSAFVRPSRTQINATSSLEEGGGWGRRSQTAYIQDSPHTTPWDTEFPFFRNIRQVVMTTFRRSSFPPCVSSRSNSIGSILHNRRGTTLHIHLRLVTPVRSHWVALDLRGTREEAVGAP